MAAGTYHFGDRSSVATLLSAPSTSYENDVSDFPTVAAAVRHSLTAVWAVMIFYKFSMSSSGSRSCLDTVFTTGRLEGKSSCFVLYSSVDCCSFSITMTYTSVNISGLMFNTGASSSGFFPRFRWLASSRGHPRLSVWCLLDGQHQMKILTVVGAVVLASRKNSTSLIAISGICDHL